MTWNDAGFAEKCTVVIDTIDYHIKNLKKRNKTKPLLECVNLHEELIPYANDYKINVFEIS